jgi:hypothetical protein
MGHVWTAPWQELSDVSAALVGCGHVSGPMNWNNRVIRRPKGPVDPTSRFLSLGRFKLKARSIVERRVSGVADIP